MAAKISPISYIINPHRRRSKQNPTCATSLSLSQPCATTFPKKCWFARLPVKSLLRFLSVSKPWRSLISSPNFIATHLTHCTANNNPLFLLLRHCSLNPNQEHFSLRFDDNTFNPYTPFNSQYFFRVVGTCNGLLCLSDDWFGDKHRVILWNPLIQRYVTLPAPNFTVRAFGPYQSFPGLGVDSLTNDYKVVRVVYPHKLDMLHCQISPPKVEVYSLRTRSWKPITASVPSCNMVEFFWRQVFVNGAAHWIGYNRRQGEGKTHNVILCFGMGNEAFGKMGLPEAVVSMFPLFLGLHAVHNTISVDFYDKMATCTRFSSWVM
ncbi:F-box protein CPR1-like [Rhododendron vialii]|uniref:F-box protein CPR1-like n=1 Tax=Rhododendron vialii TaxID=182163 RepID=UPI00265FEF63|nr:F-box protein CPR1-like [Rhododendron vialii]